MMFRETAVDPERSFIASLGLPELVHMRNIPNDVFYRHKQTAHKALRARRSTELRSQSVKTPAMHMRVEKDFDTKYEDLYKNHAAKLREHRLKTDDSHNSSFITECRTPIKLRNGRRTPSMSHFTSNSSIKTSARTVRGGLAKQSASFIAHARQTLSTEKENTSVLFKKCRQDITRPHDPIREMERGYYSRDFVKDALDDYKETEKSLYIHTNAGGNFRHRVTSRKLKELNAL